MWRAQGKTGASSTHLPLSKEGLDPFSAYFALQYPFVPHWSLLVP